jgi:hypothetical protein
MPNLIPRRLPFLKSSDADALNFPSISTNPVSGFIFHILVGSLDHLFSTALSKALICLGFNFPDQLGSSISSSLQIFPYSFPEESKYLQSVSRKSFISFGSN